MNPCVQLCTFFVHLCTFKISKFKMTGDYKTEVSLKHNEIAAKINVETGEVKPVNKPRGDSDKTMVKFDLMSVYHRSNPKAWQTLETQTTPLELKVALKLAHFARAYTNSLIPLSDDTTAITLAEQLDIDRRMVAKCIDKLFKLGVIGKFEVYNSNQVHTKYWVFNPYLSFNGSKIKTDVVSLFSETTYAYVSRANNN